ncbi:MAG: lysostaphin resistance A-like protein [Planctomycetota bacterium]
MTGNSQPPRSSARRSGPHRYRPPGTFGVLRLMAATSLRRLLRAASVNRSRRDGSDTDGRRRDAAGGARSRKRQPTARKSSDGLGLLMLMALPIFLVQAAFVSSQAVHKLEVGALKVAPGAELVIDSDLYWDMLSSRPKAESEVATVLERNQIGEDHRPSRSQISAKWRERGLFGFVSEDTLKARSLLVDAIDWPNDRSRRIFTMCAAVLLAVLLVTLLFLAFGGANATLASGSWIERWLMTFPVPTRALVTARALEYSIVQFLPWLTMMPLLWMVLRALDQPYALPLAVLTTLCATFLVGSFRLLGETWLRTRYSLGALKNVQGACTIGGLIGMATVFGVALGKSVPDFFVDSCRALPDVVTLLPGAWALAIPTIGWIALPMGLAVGLGMFAFTVFGTSRLLQRGSMQSQGVDPGRRGGSSDWLRHAKRLGVVGKDLLLLRRDRNFMVQALLVPIFIVGLQLLLNPRLAEGSGLTAVAYFAGGYGALNGCLQVLSGEGRALWMLYSLPVSIAEVLRRKTRMWGGVAVAFSLLALALCSLRVKVLDPAELAFDAVCVSFGAWCAAHLASGIGVLGANTTGAEVSRQPKVRHVYLFLFLMASYVPPLLTREPATRLVSMLVFGTLSYALWQRALVRTKWLLDPVDDARPQITLLDGSLAIVVFLLLQTLALAVLNGRSRDGLDTFALTAAFVASGGVALLGTMVVQNVRGVDVAAGFGLKLRGATAMRVLGACGLGLLAGAVLGVAGLLYLGLLRDAGWKDMPVIPDESMTGMLVLSVVVAPLVEELLFRGLLLTGLMHTVRPTYAVIWSALLFAVVHPEVSWPPVFLLGIICAMLVQRTRLVPAAMCAHAAYNFVVVYLQ